MKKFTSKSCLRINLLRLHSNYIMMPSQEPTDAQAAPKVIIVGAGPVGLIIALRLARVGIRSDVFEKEAVLNTAPRALGYYGGSLISLARAGVLDKVKAAGFTASGVCWRKAVTGSAGGSGAIGDVIARVQFPTGDPGSPLGADACVCLMQSQLTALLYQETQETGLVNVAFNMELTSINDKEDSVIATFKNRDADTYETREAAFLVGADGGKSTTRSLLGIQLMGHSWPERLVAIDALYELETDPKWPISFIVDPIHFGLMAPLEPWKVGQKTLYRVTAAVGMTDQRPDEELCSTQSVRHILERTLPGAQSQEAEIKRAATYRIHQLCASTFRKGRCALAGDAAHLKNVCPLLIYFSHRRIDRQRSRLEPWASQRGCWMRKPWPTRWS